MDFLPHDPAILVSSINMFLRDEEFDSLESICYCYGKDPQEIKDYLLKHGFVWSEEQKQMRPIGYDNKITKDEIELAYSFFHQKLRIYEFSTLDWQKEDIEFAIASYAESMNSELYRLISNGNRDFLHTHATFAQDLRKAKDMLEQMI